MGTDHLPRITRLEQLAAGNFEEKKESRMIRIKNDKSGQEAYKIEDNYHCYPKSTNLKKDRQEFRTVEDAAVFLIRNPSFGIRMNPGSAIIYRDIVIEI